MSKRRPNAVARELAAIVADIRETYRNDTANVIRRGNLLIEAKAQVRHGQWLAWLGDNFSLDKRTAQRAMAAAKFAAKYDTMSLLNLSVEVLHCLSVGDYPEAVVAAAMNEAKTKFVGMDQLWALVPRPVTEEEIEAEIIAEAAAEAQREAKEQAEADAILDGPPPDLPSAEPIAPVDFLLPAFDQMIGKLKELSTKPLDKFCNSSHSASDIEKVAEFLHQVARKQPSKKLPATLKVNGQPVSAAAFSPEAQAQIADALSDGVPTESRALSRAEVEAAA